MGLDATPPTSPLLDNTPGPNGTPFDSTLPSIRLVQQWIRQQQPVVTVLHQGLRLQGQLLWQDPMVLALQLHQDQEPVLVQRQSIALIHLAAVSLEKMAQGKPTAGGATPPVGAAGRQRPARDDHGAVFARASSGQS